MSELIPLLKEPPPKKRGSRKLMLILVLLFLILLSILFFNSNISKVSVVTIEGEQFTKETDIRNTASVRPGDAFFGTMASTVEQRISSLGSVKQAKVEKTFPGQIRIIVEEFPAVAFEMDDAGRLSAILASGTIIEADTGSAVVDKPVLSGWRKDDPIKKKLCQALAAIPAQELNQLSEISPSPTESYPDRIRIYTRSGFEVITAASLLKDKLLTLNSVVEERAPGRVTLLLADTYSPFQTESEEGEQKEGTEAP
ncbi:cell division protein FtsQ [Paenibacillaceae bacterium GAS479]|nr:cell division protein FtsQ [Paenibacillaceae bacterium GAS479]